MSVPVATRQAALTRRVDPQRTLARPQGSAPARGGIEHLQRMLGNRGMHRLLGSNAIQTKLAVGPADDEYEREADHVADEVMRMPDPASTVTAQRSTPRLQRTCAECEEEDVQRAPVVQPKCAACEEADEEADIQRKSDPTHEKDEEDKDVVQAKSRNADPPEASSELSSYVAATRGGGMPLPDSTRAFFEDRFGEDFSGVRVHSDTRSANAAAEINSYAFATGSDIHFASGQFQPGTPQGDRLLAHELTHTIQQTGGQRVASAGEDATGNARPSGIWPMRDTRSSFPRSNAIQTKLVVGPADDEYEREADRVADGVMRMPEPEATKESAVATKPLVQRVSFAVRGEDDEETPPTAPPIQRQFEEEEEEVEPTPVSAELSQPRVQPKRAHRLTSSATAPVGATIRVMSGGGSPVLSRQPLAPPAPPKVTEPVELKGKGQFSPSEDVALRIKSALGNPVSVAVKFGSLAVGELPVIWNGLWYESGSPPPNHDGHPIPVHHEGFAVAPSARPVLGVNINQGIVTGFFGWRTSAALSNDPATFFELHPLHELFGWKGLETIAPGSGDLDSALSHGKLSFAVTNIGFGVGAFDGTGELTLHDENLKVDLGVDIEVKGLNKARLPLVRDPANRLFAGKSFQFDRSLPSGIGGLSGKITGSFGNGIIDVQGTLRYSSKDPKISGSVTVIVTDFEIAKEKVRDQLGADAPSIEPADPADHLAIVGFGQLDFTLSEWLTGNAEVILHPEGYVTARGEIVPTKVIPVFKRKAEKKELFGRQSAGFPLAAIPLWGNISADGHVGPMWVHGSFGAGTLHDLRVSGLVSNHPGIVNRFELSGIVSSPATAGLTLEAGAKISAKLLHVVEVLSAGLTAQGNLQLNMLAEAGIQVGRRAGPIGKPEYYIEGNLEATAELVLDLHLWFSGSVLVWKGHIKAVDRTYKLGNVGVGLHFLAAIDKDGESRVEPDFSKVSFDADKFLAAVVRSETVQEKGYKGESDVGADTKGEIQPEAPLPPEVTPAEEKGRDIAGVVRKDFTMMAEPHRLVLTLTKPPRLEMSTDPPAKPLRKKVSAARAVLKKDTTSPEKSKAQLVELDKIEAVSKQVEEAGAKAAAAPRDTDVHTPGFNEVADLLHGYGERFQETDLASGIAGPPSPAPTPVDPPTGSTAQLALAKATFKTEHWIRKELQDLLKVSETTAKDRIRDWRHSKQLFALETSASDPFKAYNFDEARAGERPLKDTESNRAKYGFKNPGHESAQGQAILVKGIRPSSPLPSDPASRYDSMRGGTRAKPPSPYVDFPRPIARLGHGPVGASEFWNEGKPKPGHMQSKEENHQWNFDPKNYWGPEHKEESDASGGSSPRYLVPMRSIGSHDDWL